MAKAAGKRPRTSRAAQFACACALVAAASSAAALAAGRVEKPIFYFEVPPRTGPRITRVSFHPPTDRVRFYHARVALAPAQEPYKIVRASVGGREETFVPYVDGRPWRPSRERGTQWVIRSVDPHIPAGKEVMLHVSCGWRAGGAHALEVEYEVDRGEKVGRAVLRNAARATGDAGFPYPGWRSHRVLVLAEEHGIARTNWPVTFFISAPGDEVRSFEDEIRVARYDPAAGTATEVPSQVLFEKAAPASGAPGSAFRTCEVAFLADVPAHGRAYYVVAYGNPDAERPTYESDLRVTKHSDGSTWVENEFYRVQLHRDSGQIAGIECKRFGAGERRQLGFSRFVLHYNPDVWVKGRRWTHTHGWSPPPHTETVAGPIAVVTRRWGGLPRAKEVGVNVVYTFFSRTPYVLVDSTIDVVSDVVVNALRNDEVVVSPPSEVDHVGWRDPGGRVHYKPAEFDPNRTRGMIAVTSAEAPYVCLVREREGWGLAGIQLHHYYGSRDGGPAVLATSHTSIADYGWGFLYWSRVLAFPWGDYQPDVPAVLNAGTFYSTRAAYCVFPLEQGEGPEERLAYIERLDRLLRAPLRIDHQGAGPW